VNLTSRIEELTKRFRAQILVTDRALSHVDTDGLNMRKVMSLKVRGKEEVTELFELFEANHPDDLQLKIETKPMLEQAIRCYEAHQFEEAKSCFQKVLNVNDSDVLATDYMVRCRYLSKFPSSELSQLGVLEDMNHYLNYASQRRDFRHPVRISGKVQWGEMCFPHEDVTFSNLSLRGMRMEGCKLPLKIGSIIKLYLFTSEVLPYFKSDLEVVSQVVWSNEKHENAQLGLQIVWMTRENEDGLIYLLEKLEQKKDSES
jgi:hypothetical protein